MSASLQARSNVADSSGFASSNSGEREHVRDRVQPGAPIGVCDQVGIRNQRPNAVRQRDLVVEEVGPEHGPVAPLEVRDHGVQLAGHEQGKVFLI